MLDLKEEYFQIVKLDAVIPNHKQIAELGRGRELNAKSGISQSTIQDENEMWALVQEIVVQAATNPDEVV